MVRSKVVSRKWPLIYPPASKTNTLKPISADASALALIWGFKIINPSSVPTLISKLPKNFKVSVNFMGIPIGVGNYKIYLKDFSIPNCGIGKRTFIFFNSFYFLSSSEFLIL